MPVRLVPASEGKSIRLDQPVLLVGRNPDCDVILKCSRKVSRVHCLVAVANNKVIVRDLASTNGVWINGHRVEREAKVRLGDELAIADVLYYLINEEQAGRDTPAGEQTPEREHRETLDEPVIDDDRESVGDLASASLQADLLALEPGVDVPVPIPEEEDSFAVEASMPRVPRVVRKQLRPDSSSDANVHFRRAGEDSDDVIPVSRRDA